MWTKHEMRTFDVVKYEQIGCTTPSFRMAVAAGSHDWKRRHEVKRRDGEEGAREKRGTLGNGRKTNKERKTIQFCGETTRLFTARTGASCGLYGLLSRSYRSALFAAIGVSPTADRSTRNSRFLCVALLDAWRPPETRRPNK